jgi:hypothetical protein
MEFPTPTAAGRAALVVKQAGKTNMDYTARQIKPRIARKGRFWALRARHQQNRAKRRN